jgi:hypothetical protein
MPYPGYNEGEPPGCFGMAVGAAVLLILLIVLRSCVFSG